MVILIVAGNKLFADLTNKVSKSVFLYALKFYLLIAVPLCLLIATGHYLDRRFEHLDWQTNQTELISQVKTELAYHYYEAMSDIMVIADNHNLFSGNRATNTELAQHFKRLARINRSYYQLRFIDIRGQEIVRVNFTGDTPERAPEEKLQNKSHRPYFQSAIDMKKNEIFISRFDLNIERRKIEKPLRPVIRFATPVYDNNGNKLGILVLNYLGEKLLHLLSFYDRNNDGHLFLLNEQGYYLYSSDKSKTWGFQIPGRPSFADDFQEWEKISYSTTGKTLSQNGLFTYDTVNNLEQTDQNWLEKYTPLVNARIVTEESQWKIVSFVNNELIFGAANDRLRNAIIGAALVLVLIIPFSLLWGRTRSHADELLNRDRIYAQVVNQSDELIYLTDLNGVIQHANPAVELHTGYTINELLGKTPTIFKSGIQTDSFYHALWESLQEGKSFEGIFINKRKDGDLFYEAKTITPLYDIKGMVQMYVSTGKDITIHRNMFEREMDIYETISGGLEHHFGNMLNAISGFSQLILMESKHDKGSSVSRFISEVISASKKAEKLLSDISTISCVSPQSLHPTNLYPLLQATVEKWRKETSKKLVLTTRLTKNIPKIKGDKESIMIALRAMLENANDAVSGDGNIEIALEKQDIKNKVCVTCGEPLHGEYVVISVSDSGDGIPSEIQNRIWDPFFTTKESAKLVGVTAGLGLSTVRAITHKNNGHILLDSSSKPGTTIQLLFPIPED